MRAITANIPVNDIENAHSKVNKLKQKWYPLWYHFYLISVNMIKFLVGNKTV
ncbi:hypothetical protein LDI01_07800 [Lentilactobacillus diolivorans]|uniref:Transposase n=1 Tax=Lentilactobacillus diolivorans TaxID=179838 RepID=A0ABQ0XAQ7_9LACO|nr:hypothetical protein LDI01_07800 [Lentilactobacillus diolivorans]